MYALSPSNFEFDDFVNFTSIKFPADKDTFREALDSYISKRLRYTGISNTGDQQRFYYSAKFAKDFIIQSGMQSFNQAEVQSFFDKKVIHLYLNDMIL